MAKLSVGQIVALSICAAIIFVVLLVIVLGAVMRAGRSKNGAAKKRRGERARAYGTAQSNPSDDLTDRVLLDHFLAMLRRDGISLRMLAKNSGNGKANVFEVRLHLLGDDELSWMRGSISLRDVDDLSQGRFPQEENATGPDPMEGVASDLCFSLLARGGRRVDLIANSSLEKQALKQGFEMYIKKLRENAPVMPASASVESYSGSDASSTSSSAAAGGGGGGGGGSRGGSRGGGGGGRSSDVASNSSTTALPMIGDEEDGEDDGGEDAPLLD